MLRARGRARLDGLPLADAEGFYDVQRSGLDHHQARGVLHSDGGGRNHLRSAVAEAQPIPHDGPVGKMPDKLGCHPWRPAHPHFMIEVPGFETLATHVFRDRERYLDSDLVFGVRSSLIADWVRREPGTAPDGSASTVPFHTLDVAVVLDRA